MKLLISLVILQASLLFVSSETIRTKNCDGTELFGNTTAVEVDPCPTQPCVLHKGGSSTIKVHFTPNANTTTLKMALHGYVSFVWVPFPISEPSVCDDSEGSECKCPLTAGENYIASKTVPIASYFPSMNVKISVELKDQDDNDITCVEFPLTLA